MNSSLFPSCLATFACAAVLAVGIPEGTALAGAAEPWFTPQRIAETRQVTAVALAPDARHTAYTLAVPRQAGVDEDGEPWSELWVVAQGNTAPSPFVTGRVNVSAVRWTPDGRELAFLAKRGDDKVKSLYVIPLAGGESRRVLSPATDIVDYSFAADGEHVAYIAREPEDEARKKLRDLGFKAEVYEEDWRVQRVWTVRIASPDTPVALKIEGHARAVRWSPVDDRLLVVVTPTPSVDDSLMRQRMCVIDATTGVVTARPQNPGKLGNFAWSPDGRP